MSKPRQLNLKLDEEASGRFDRLLLRMRGLLGIELSQPQLIGLALKALEEKCDSDPKRKDHP